MGALTLTTPRTIGAVALIGGVAVALAVGLLRLSIGGALAIYFIVWWTVLFAILPFAAREGSGTGIAGTDPGAPTVPRLREKAVWTTLWSDLVFLAAVTMLPLAGF